MGYEINYEIEVRARLENCKEIGAAWIKAILAEVPTAHEALAELNTRHGKAEPSSKMQLLNWERVWEIDGADLNLYYDLGAVPFTINLWWGDGRAGVHANSNFNALETIAGISKSFPHAIFRIVESANICGNVSCDESVMFAGEVVATVGGR